MKSLEGGPEYGPGKKESSPKSPVRLVKLSPDQWEELRDFKISSLQQEPIAFEDFESGMTRYQSRTEEEWRNWLTNRNRVALFAMDNGRPVGMVSALVGENTAYVQHMYVEENYRGRGISRDLLGTLLESAKLKGAKRATLGVLKEQTAAISLYQSFGFKETAEMGVFRSGKSYKELLMEKVL